MRSLVSGTYTAAQVEAQLRAGHANHSSRFELLDATLAVVGELTTVLGAVVEMNVDRAIKSALRLRMLPDDRLTFPFEYRIKPWYRIQMPDGGWAEFPLGVFIWNTPERELLPEVWDVTLGDLGHLLESGPGPGGYQASAGASVTNVIADVLTRAGFSGIGVAYSASTLAEGKSWGVVTGTPLPPVQPDPPAPEVAPVVPAYVPTYGDNPSYDASEERPEGSTDATSAERQQFLRDAAERDRQRSFALMEAERLRLIGIGEVHNP